MYQMINWPFVFEGVLLVTHSFVLYLFPFTFLISTYWFVFFKLQVSGLGAVRTWWLWYLSARRAFVSFLRPLRVDTETWKTKTKLKRTKILHSGRQYNNIMAFLGSNMNIKPGTNFRPESYKKGRKNHLTLYTYRYLVYF